MVYKFTFMTSMDRLFIDPLGVHGPRLRTRQACQTGSPRAACGPIACSMWPAVTFYDPHIIEK